MRPLLLSICALFILTACGGGPRDEGAASAAAEPVPGDVIDGRVLCEVGALEWRDDGLLTLAFWCDQSEGYRPGDEVVMIDEGGEALARAQVHRTAPDQGAMSVRIRENDLWGDVVRGTEFLIALP